MPYAKELEFHWLLTSMYVNKNSNSCYMPLDK